MKFFFIVVFSFSLYPVISQSADSSIIPIQPAAIDSRNNIPSYRDTAMENRLIRNNFENITHLQNDYDKKQRNRAVLRIALGVLGLIVLIISISRRRKSGIAKAN